MANIFTLENIADFSEKLNIDDLYEKKRHHDLSQLSLFNKILNRIHVRIKQYRDKARMISFVGLWFQRLLLVCQNMTKQRVLLI